MSLKRPVSATGLRVFVGRETVKSSILDVFAGPPDTGVFSPSVQKTLYDSQKLILSKVPQVTVNTVEGTREQYSVTYVL